MKYNHLLTLLLAFCMVFSTSASAFLHLGEHQHYEAHNEHQLNIDDHHHDSHEGENDHEHHFNLHVVGDLVEYDSPLLICSVGLSSWDYSSQLISRTYTPPIPPPNA